MRPWSTVIDLVIDLKCTARHMDINWELHGMSFAHLLGLKSQISFVVMASWLIENKPKIYEFISLM